MILRIGLHEAGHYIITRALGFKAGAITLMIMDLRGGHKGGSEITLASALSGDQDIIDYLERRVIVLYSGALAESLSQGKVNNDYAIKCLHSGGGMGDYDKARELIQLIRNIKFPNSSSEVDIQNNLDLIDSELWNKAASLVEKDHIIIQGIGSRVASEIIYTNEKITLSEAELNALPAIQERFASEA